MFTRLAHDLDDIEVEADGRGYQGAFDEDDEEGMSRMSFLEHLEH